MAGEKQCCGFSIEMAEDQYIRRCMELGLGTGQRERLHIVEQIPETTPEEIKKKLLALREKMTIGLVVIDYLQLMGCGEKKNTADFRCDPFIIQRSLLQRRSSQVR